MRNIISIHIGKCGTNIGHQHFEKICNEHKIFPDGFIDVEENSDEREGISTMFDFSKDGMATPRALFIDCPSGIEKLSSGKFKDMYKSDNFIKSNIETGGLYSRGFDKDKVLIDSILLSIRSLVMRNTVEGFIITHSTGGGLGSGFTSKVLQNLHDIYSKTIIFVNSIFPFNFSKKEKNIVSPYNSVFSMNNILKHPNVAFVYDNDSLYDICKHGLNVSNPQFSNMNNVLTTVMSTINAGWRRNLCWHTTMTEIETNLIRGYPKMKFILSGYAPFVPKSVRKYLEDDEGHPAVPMTKSSFRKSHTLASCDPCGGKFMACSLLFRGDIIPKDVGPAIRCIKCYGGTSDERVEPKVTFVDWSPTGFKCGIDYEKPYYDKNGDFANVERSVLNLSNTSGVKEVFKVVKEKCKVLYKKNSYVHWYEKDGMEKSEFCEAKENIEALICDYDEVEKDIHEDEGEEGEEGEEEGENIE